MAGWQLPVPACYPRSFTRYFQHSYMITTHPDLVAFHGQQAIKNNYLNRMEAHRAAGDLNRDNYHKGEIGLGQEETCQWRGSALHCLVYDDTDQYGAAETQLGVPRVLVAALSEFAGNMSPERHTAWPGQFLQAIPVGADLAGVWPQFAMWLLVAEPGVLRFAQTERQRSTIQTVADLYRRVLAGEKVLGRDWENARRMAESGPSPGYAAASAALDSLVAAPVVFSDTDDVYAEAYAAATTALNADLELANAYGDALAAERATHTAVVAVDVILSTDTGFGVGIESATAAAALVTTPVAVATAADYIASRQAHRLGCHYLFNDEHRDFILRATYADTDTLADKLLELLAAAPVRQAPFTLGSGQSMPESRPCFSPATTLKPASVITVRLPLVAFLGQQAIKNEFLGNVKVHRAAGDRIRKRAETAASRGRKSKGEAPRFSLTDLFPNNTDRYRAAKMQLGVPKVLMQTLELLFEKISPERHITWPGQVLAAIPVGADLGGVWPQLAVWLLVAEPGMLRFAQTDSQRAAIQEVADLYTKIVHGEKVPRQTWLMAQMAVGKAINATSRALTVIYADMTTAPASSPAAAEAYRAYCLSTLVMTGMQAARHACEVATHGNTVAPFIDSTASAYRSAVYANTLIATTANTADTDHYDELAGKLLELLAAAPVAQTPSDTQLTQATV